MSAKKITLLIVSYFFVSMLNAQEVVEWKFCAKKLDDKTYEIRIKASIDKPWHIYSMNTPEGGALPTTINFAKNPVINFYKGIEEVGESVEKFETVFKADVKYYENEVEFVQVVKRKISVKTNVMGYIEYMACTNERCLTPVKKNFTIPIQ